MKFKIGDRVQIISDTTNMYPEYIGNFAIITDIDKKYEYPYQLKVFDINDAVIDDEMLWEESGLQLATPELVEQRSQESLDKFNSIKVKIQKAADYAGITMEQVTKFIEGFNLE